MKVVSGGSGFAVETDSYRFRIRDRSWFAVLADATGREWAEICLVAEVETIDGPDETDVLDGPEILELDDRIRLTWSAWFTKVLPWPAHAAAAGEDQALSPRAASHSS